MPKKPAPQTQVEETAPVVVPTPEPQPPAEVDPVLPEPGDEVQP